ncbi:MAG: hypothetical protein ACE5I1_09805 [bacterium]
MIGETSLVYEGWRSWAEQLEFTASLSKESRLYFSEVVAAIQQQADIEILEEHPGELVPLPDDFEERAIPIDLAQSTMLADAQENGKLKNGLDFYHFDPYSVAFRYIARGDEQDYQLVLSFLEHGWLTLEKMDALLADLLPRFSFQTLQQDPAEFRRKYKGLTQMFSARRPAK